MLAVVDSLHNIEKIGKCQFEKISDQGKAPDYISNIISKKTWRNKGPIIDTSNINKYTLV